MANRNFTPSTHLAKLFSKVSFGIGSFVQTAKFKKLYLIAAFAVLMLTTIYWSLLGARLHLSNADNLVNSLMFNSVQGLHDSLLPQAHTFLIKWPLFLLAGLLGNKAVIITIITILVCLLTIVSFAILLYKIEKRPMVIGTIYFAISSMLLLVPAVPYAGALLPVSMAMLSTRNIEYMFFILALVSIIKSNMAYSNRWFISSVILLSLLFASDKLFVTLSLGGSILMITAFAITRNWRIVSFATHWLVATSVATVTAVASLYLINRMGLVHIANEGSSLGPYGLARTVKDFALGSFYAVTGVLSQFGANPIYDTTEISQIPIALKNRLFSPEILGLIVNLAFVSMGLYMTIRLMLATLTTKPSKNRPLALPPILSVMLIAVTLVAIGSFIVTKHAYLVDARYVAIAFFAVLISTATFARATNISAVKLTMIGFVTSIVIVSSLFAVTLHYSDYRKPLIQYSDRNTAIVKALHDNPVDYIVGDYWRVLPITLQAGQKPLPSPLGSCAEYRSALTRTDWQPNLENANFAYLLSFDKALTDYPACNVDKVISYYGTPNRSILISGSVENPQELLLIYNHGKKQSSVAQPDKKTSVIPALIGNLRTPKCTKQTIMTIVAHQDDDILFTNPDLQRNIDSGDCIRTIYLTAGDGGMNEKYWEGRERGAIAAYSHMAQVDPTDWVYRIYKVTGHAYVNIATPRHDRSISLIFMRLPDGGLQGEGFASSNFTNLPKLYGGIVQNITSVDGQSSYANNDITSTLVSLMSYYKPSVIRSQSSDNSSSLPDHADHIAVSHYAQEAYSQYNLANPNNQIAINTTFVTYMGYPVREHEENISSTESNQKIATFLAYAQQDGAVCKTTEECLNTPTYGEYLKRQYVKDI